MTSLLSQLASALAPKPSEAPQPDPPSNAPAIAVDQDVEPASNALQPPRGFTDHDFGVGEDQAKDAEPQVRPARSVAPLAPARVRGVRDAIVRELTADNFTADEFAVTDTPRQLIGDDPTRLSLLIMNTGAATVRLSRQEGFGPTAGRGSIPLAAGASIDLDVSCAVHVACESVGATSTVAILSRMDTFLS